MPGVFPPPPAAEGLGIDAGPRHHRRKHHLVLPNLTSAVAAKASLASLNAPSATHLHTAAWGPDGDTFFAAALAAPAVADGTPVTHHVRYPSGGGAGVYHFSGVASTVGAATTGTAPLGGVRVDSTASSVDSLALAYAGGGGGGRDELKHGSEDPSAFGGDARRPLKHATGGGGADGFCGSGGGGGLPNGHGGAAAAAPAVNNTFYLPDVFSFKSIKVQSAKRAAARQQVGEGGNSEPGGQAQASASAARHGRPRNGAAPSSGGDGGSHRPSQAVAPK